MKVFKIVEKRNLWIFTSLLVIALGFGLMGNKAIKAQPALNFGIDFAGGTSMLLKFDTLNNDTNKDAFIGNLRTILAHHHLEKSSIQITNGNEVMIKTLELNNNKHQVILDEFEKSIGKMEVLEIDFIGPTIGAELKETSLWIVLVTSCLLLIYISVRFQFLFGVAALIALLHDALITISFASLLNLEINTAFVAAILTILGYSINDTIVIFDRVRENFNHFKTTESLADIINQSLSQTFIRTINTSVTTLLVIGSIIMFGGNTIKEFCIVLLIGIVAGTYSSLFIASPILYTLKKDKELS
jgi:preprotein translocase subunit SecF